MAFNTWKFMSYAAAVAWCRTNNVSPVDHVVCRASFVEPVVLETRDIDYSDSTLSVAT
jgi:hypothetical protein